jgi:hypothetical protein
MLAPESQSLDLDVLDRELHSAHAVTSPLFRKVVGSGACTRLPSLRQMGKNLPIFLDEPAEGSHAVLALAVLRAFVAARCMSAATQQVTASVPQVRPRTAFVFCCDNLA